MVEKKATRLSKAAREFNVGISTIVEFLAKKGHDIDSNPNTKLDPELYVLLVDEYSTDLNVKKESEKLTMQTFRDKQEGDVEDEVITEPAGEEPEELLITDMNTTTEEAPAPAKAAKDKPSSAKATEDKPSSAKAADDKPAPKKDEKPE